MNDAPPRTLLIQPRTGLIGQGSHYSLRGFNTTVGHMLREPRIAGLFPRLPPLSQTWSCQQDPRTAELELEKHALTFKPVVRPPGRFLEFRGQRRYPLVKPFTEQSHILPDITWRRNHRSRRVKRCEDILTDDRQLNDGSEVRTRVGVRPSRTQRDKRRIHRGCVRDGESWGGRVLRRCIRRLHAICRLHFFGYIIFWSHHGQRYRTARIYDDAGPAGYDTERSFQGVQTPPCLHQRHSLGCCCSRDFVPYMETKRISRSQSHSHDCPSPRLDVGVRSQCMSHMQVVHRGFVRLVRH
jgi:hypothetical protein